MYFNIIRKMSLWMFRQSWKVNISLQWRWTMSSSSNIQHHRQGQH